MGTKKDKLLLKYEKFVNELSDTWIEAFNECRASIIYCFNSKTFEVWPNRFRWQGEEHVTVYDTNGGNPYYDPDPETDEFVYDDGMVDQIRGWIIEDGNGDLEVVRYHDSY